MAERFRLPALGHTMEKGRVVEWLVAEGERVERGAPLLSVETDKAVVEVESPASGVVLRLVAAVDQELKVGGTLAWIGEPGDAVDDTPDDAGGEAAVSAERRVTPVARRLAERHGIDADALEGTGPGGRVTKEDVQRAVESGVKAPAKAPARSLPPGTEVVPVTGIRRTAAERLSASWAATPLVTLGVEVDLGECVAVRAAHAEAWREQHGIVPNLNDIVLKAAVDAVTAHPRLNAAWMDGEIHQYAAVNVGVAMDVPEGLIVPVIHAAGAMDVFEIARQARRLLRRSRKGELTLADLEGATFTVTNLAPLGVDWFTPVLNPPQCAILGVGRVRRAAVPVGDAILARDVSTLVLSFDHRVLDGAPCARYLEDLRGRLERPREWLGSI